MTRHALVLASLLLLSHAAADKYDLGDEPASTDGPTSTPPETHPAITQKPSYTDAPVATPNLDHKDFQFPFQTATEEELLRPCPRGHCDVVNFVPNFYGIILEILKVPAKMLELLKIVWASVYEQLVLRITNGQASTLNVEMILQKIAALKRLSVKLDLPHVKFLNLLRPGTLLHAWTRNLRALFKFPFSTLLRFVGAQVPEDQIEGMRAVAKLLADVLSHTVNVLRSLHDGQPTISVLKRLLPIFDILGISSSLGDLLRWLQFVPYDIDRHPTYNFQATRPTNPNSFNWKGLMWPWNRQPFGIYPQNPFWESYWRNPSTGGYRSRVRTDGATSTTGKPTTDESKTPYMRDHPTSKDACEKPQSQWTVPQAVYQIFKELFPQGSSAAKPDTWSVFDEPPAEIKPFNSSWLPDSPFPFVPRRERPSYSLPQNYLYPEKSFRSDARPWYYSRRPIPNYGFGPILGRPANNWNIFGTSYLPTSSHWVTPKFPVPYSGSYQIGGLYGTNWNTPFLNRPDQKVPIIPTKRDNLWSFLIPKKKSTTAFPYKQRYFDRFADPYSGKQTVAVGTKKSKILDDGGSQPETQENECNQQYANANKKFTLDIIPVINRN